MNVVWLADCWDGYSQLPKTLVNFAPDIHVTVVRFSELSALCSILDAQRPDLFVYFGHPDPSLITEPIAHKLKTTATPAVLILQDAHRPVWGHILGRFIHDGTFDLIVETTGNDAWPMRRQDITTVFPVDHSQFGRPRPWSERTRTIGFAGTHSSTRQQIFAGIKYDVIEGQSQDDENYKTYVDFMKSCEFIINGATGPHVNIVHIRSIEAGLAGCVLLEHTSTLLSKWFRPGVDYVEWTSKEELDAIMQGPLDLPSLAANLRQRAMTDYSPHNFWTNIFLRLSLI